MEREKLISLVTAAQCGDKGALNELFNAFYNDVYYFALKTVKDEELACDITQEAFVEILRTIGSLQEPAAFVKWMKQITYHQCTRYFKKKKDVIVDEDEDGNTIFDTVQEEKTDFIPDEALDQDEFKRTILLMLDELSEEQRAAVLLFYYDELSVKQIAEIQGVSENTVKSRLNYARKGIKKSVEDYEEKHGVKLHGIAALPLLRWVLGDFSRSAPAASAGMVAEGVSAATGVTLAVTATSASTAATATTVVTAVGVSAKIAAIPLAAKVAAGIAAAIIAIGGSTAAVILSDENKEDAPAAHVHAYEEEVQQAASCTADGAAVYTCSCGDTYTAAIPAAHRWGEWSRQGFREYRYCPVCTQNDERKAVLNTEEEILHAYADRISWLGYFDSVDNIDTLTVFKWSQCAVDPVETSEYEAADAERNETYTYRRTVYAVSELHAFTTKVLGRTWDYSVLDGQTEEHMYTYHHDAQAQKVIVDFDCRYGGMGGGIGMPYFQGYEKIDDTHFVIEYYLDYQGDEVHGNVFEVERIGANYIIVGNYSAENIPSDITNSTIGTTTGTTSGSTADATTGTTTGTATGTTTDTTAGTTTTTKPIPGHTHSFSVKTTPATCTADGKKVYTCSCGDTYTEVLAAAGHSFGSWSQTKAPTTLEQGMETRVCAGCTLKETRTVDPPASIALFTHYVTTASALPTFDSVSDLSRYILLKWCYHFCGLSYQSHAYGSGVDRQVDYVFRTVDLDAATMDCFGRTWDYSFFGDYDAAAGTVTISTAADNGFNDGEMFWDEYAGYDKVDDTQYDIYLGHSAILRVKRVDNNFVFVSFRAL